MVHIVTVFCPVFPKVKNTRLLKSNCPYNIFIIANINIMHYNSKEYIRPYIVTTQHHNETTVKIPRSALMHHNSQLINCQVEYFHINKYLRPV